MPHRTAARRGPPPRIRFARAHRLTLVRELRRRQERIDQLEAGNDRAAHAILQLQVDIAGLKSRLAARESLLASLENTPRGGAR